MKVLYFIRYDSQFSDWLSLIKKHADWSSFSSQLANCSACNQILPSRRVTNPVDNILELLQFRLFVHREMKFIVCFMLIP